MPVFTRHARDESTPRIPQQTPRATSGQNVRLLHDHTRDGPCCASRDRRSAGKRNGTRGGVITLASDEEKRRANALTLTHSPIVFVCSGIKRGVQGMGMGTRARPDRRATIRMHAWSPAAYTDTDRDRDPDTDMGTEYMAHGEWGTGQRHGTERNGNGREWLRNGTEGNGYGTDTERYGKGKRKRKRKRQWHGMAWRSRPTLHERPHGHAHGRASPVRPAALLRILDAGSRVARGSRCSFPRPCHIVSYRMMCSASRLVLPCLLPRVTAS